MMVTRLPFHREATPSVRTTRRSASQMPGWLKRRPAAAGAKGPPPGAAAAGLANASTF